MRNIETSLQAAHERIVERERSSPEGMRAAASELRSNAKTMLNASDKDTMLRIAAGYDTRAEEIEKRQRIARK